MNPMRRLLLAAALTLPATAHAQDANAINFGIVSTESSANLKSQWTPLLDDMARETKLKIVGFYPSDYAGVIEAMRFNKVQVAWFGNASAIQAVDRAEGEVFAQKVYSSGEKGYWSILIAGADSKFHALDDVLHAPDGTLTFGNGDPNSTSGFLIPSYYAWAKNNVDIRKHFKTVVSANHETNLLAVANKQVDVATNNTENFDKFKTAQPALAAKVREIWRSPIIPADPIVWRRDLPAAQKEAIRKFLLDYGTANAGAEEAREKKVLADLGGWGGFVASSNAQLLPVRQVAAFKQRLAVENDTTLGADDRAKKLAEIDAQLKTLDAEIAAAKK